MGSYNPAHKYQSVQVSSASPEALVVIAYDALLKFLNTARSRIEEKNIEKSHEALKKAQLIVLELMSALRTDVWDGAGNLLRLYEFVLSRLQEANMQKRSEPVDEILPMIHGLRDAWQQAYRDVQAGKKGSGVKAVEGTG